MERRVEALLDTLDQVSSRWRLRNAAYWADEVDRARGEIERLDAHGLRRFLHLFGGMGAIRDAFYGDAEGGKLLSAAWKVATELLRRHDELNHPRIDP